MGACGGACHAPGQGEREELEGGVGGGQGEEEEGEEELEGGGVHGPVIVSSWCGRG